MLTLRHLSKSYVAGKPVLTDIDLEIAPRGITAIIGPSGTGKSTLIRCINRLVEPTAGEILFEGRDLAKLSGTELRHARRHIGMVFQEYNLVERLTVMENLLSGRLGYVSPWRAWRRRFPAEDIRKAFELLDVVGLADFANRRADALSGGQRQRAALARAVVRHPQVFLMDEPLSNLDAKLRLSMRGQLKHIQRKLQTTTVYVTHDQIEAMTLADRIAIMDKGKIQQLGTPDEVYNNPANIFVAGFIGSTPMNLIRGDLDNGTFVAPGARVAKAGKGTRGNVVLGIRPEDVSVVAKSKGQFTAPLFTLEPTGDQTLASARSDSLLVVARAARDFRQEIGSAISFAFAPERIYLFDGTSGARL